MNSRARPGKRPHGHKQQKQESKSKTPMLRSKFKADDVVDRRPPARGDDDEDTPEKWAGYAHTTISEPPKPKAKEKPTANQFPSVGRLISFFFPCSFFPGQVYCCCSSVHLLAN